jgi:hypothetical protein
VLVVVLAVAVTRDIKFEAARALQHSTAGHTAGQRSRAQDVSTWAQHGCFI